MTKEEWELKNMMLETFPDLSDFNNKWEEIKNFFIQDGKKLQKEQTLKDVLKIIEFYEKTWEEDKDAMFNEGYMEDLFNKLKAQIEKLGEKK
jgi:hypothetical protein